MTKAHFMFNCNRWLSEKHDDFQIERDLYPVGACCARCAWLCPAVHVVLCISAFLLASILFSPAVLVVILLCLGPCL